MDSMRLPLTSVRKLVVIAATQSVFGFLYLAFTVLASVFYVTPALFTTLYIESLFLLTTGILGLHAARKSSSATLFSLTAVFNTLLAIATGWKLLCIIAIYSGVGDLFGYADFDFYRVTFDGPAEAMVTAISVVVMMLGFFLLTCAAASIGLFNAQLMAKNHIVRAVEEVLARRGEMREEVVYCEPEVEKGVLMAPPSYSQFV